MGVRWTTEILACGMLAAPAFARASVAQERPRPAAPAPAPAPGPAPSPAQRGGGEREERGPRTLGFDEVEQSEGRAGDLPPAVQRVEFAAPSVDLDLVGRARFELADLAASGDGFAVLISDERDGGRGHWIQRFDPGFAPRSPAEPLDPGASGQGQWEANLSVGAGPDGAGRLGAVWFDVADREGGRRSALRGRFLDAGARALGSVWRTPVPTGAPGTPESASPALLWTESACAVAWVTDGRLVLRRLDPLSGSSQGDLVLSRRTDPATSTPRFAAHAPSESGGGEFAIAYESGRAILLQMELGPSERAASEAGLGRLLGFAADPVGPGQPNPGWWILARRQGRLLLGHLDRGGAPDSAEVELAVEPTRAAELAVDPAGSGAVCVLLQYAAGGLDAAWCNAGGLLSTTPLAPPATTVASARVVFSSGRAGFAWTERRSGVVSLWARSSGPRGEGLSEPRPLESCSGCALQSQAAVALVADRGVVAWSDSRFDVPTVGLRGFTSGRTWAPEETFLPALPRSAPGDDTGPTAVQAAKRPALALDPSGRGLVVWFGPGPSGPTVIAQAVDVDAAGVSTAAGGSFVLEPEPVDLPTTFPAAVAALPGGRGFCVAWVRASPGTLENPRGGPDDGRSELRVAHVTRSGFVDGAPRTLGKGSRLGHPALAVLDDGRVAVAWDALPRAKLRRIAGRVLDERLEARGREFAFETMWRDSDHSPALAPAAGGFAMAWTSGEDADSDVFARLFDFDGRPLSRPLALSPRRGGQGAASLVRVEDGTHVAVWEDDLSGSPRIVGRRFVGRTRTLGPVVRFDFGPTAPGARSQYVDAQRPALLALPGGGLLLVGDHAVEGKGREIGLCRVGAGWDHVEGR